MVLGRAYQPPQRRPMDLARHHLETIWQENTSRETSQAVERRPGQILERHDMAEDSTIQGHLETTCWGLGPTTGHNGCLMMMMMMVVIILFFIPRLVLFLDEWVSAHNAGWAESVGGAAELHTMTATVGRRLSRVIRWCSWVTHDDSYSWPPAEQSQ